MGHSKSARPPSRSRRPSTAWGRPGDRASGSTWGPLVGGTRPRALPRDRPLRAGQFLDLTADEKLSRPAFEDRPAGLRLAGVTAATKGAPAESIYQWETTFPHRTFSRFKGSVDISKFLYGAIIAAGAVSIAAQKHANPYAVAPEPVRLADPGQVEIRTRTDLGVVAAAATVMATVDAYQAMAVLAAAQPELAGDLQVVGLGVAG